MYKLYFICGLLLLPITKCFSISTSGVCPPRPSDDEIYKRYRGNQHFYLDHRTGDDGWEGTLFEPDNLIQNGPFKTFLGAIKGMRRIRKCKQKKAVLLVKGGVHLVPNTITLDERDTLLSIVGHSKFDRPVISGGNMIPRTEFSKLDDKIYFAPYDGPCTRNAFLGRKRLLRARKPSLENWTGKDFTGQGPYLTIKNLLINTEDCNINGTGGFTQHCPDENKNGFVYADGDINPNWSNLDKAEIFVYQAWDAERGTIGRVDKDTNSLYFERPLRYAVGSHPKPSGWRYIVENVYEELDSVGEYYCDEKKGMFYFIPPEGALEAEDVFVGTADVMLEVTYGEGIDLYDLELRHGNDRDIEGTDETPSLLTFEYSRNISIENCCFTNVGYTAIYLLASININIAENRFTDLGYFAIGTDYKGDINDPLATRYITIRKNTFRRCGVVNMYQPACVHVRGVSDIYVTDNDIGFTPYAGMRVGWQSTFSAEYKRPGEYVFYILRNHVHNFGLGMLNDFAGIYLSSNSGCSKADAAMSKCFLDAYIANNVIHRSVPYYYGGIGVYGDTAASHLTVEKNWIYDLSDAAVNFHCGQQNQALNNMIQHVNSERVFGVCNSIVGNGTEVKQILTFKQNVVYVTNTDARLWRKADRWDYEIPDVDYNDYYFDPSDETQMEEFFPSTVQGAGVSFEHWRKETGNDLHSIIEDPLYMDMKKEDFRLTCQSPALKLGIKSVDLRYVRLLSGTFGV
ncbi:unnamed protein product [Clavelina lepadiformis]|uniref:Right handed beta helix domain-containing protein n=1 Tax=Clavelina lepadiformis TaxID=159417 RepID=A0ABP0F5K8_CLALP